MKHIEKTISLSLIMATTIVLGIFGACQCLYVYLDLRSELRHFASISMKHVSEQWVSPVWSVDVEQAEKIVASYMDDERVHAVIVKDQGGEILSGMMRGQDRQLIPATGDIAGSFVYDAQPILYADGVIGTVEMYLTKEFMRRGLLVEILKIILTVIVLDVMLVISQLRILRRIFVQPFNHMFATAKKIAGGDFNHDFPVRAADEIGVVEGTNVIATAKGAFTPSNDLLSTEDGRFVFARTVDNQLATIDVRNQRGATRPIPVGPTLGTAGGSAIAPEVSGRLRSGGTSSGRTSGLSA